MERHDDERWRWAYFGPQYVERRRRAAGIPPDHVPAPRRLVRSDAMTDVVARDAARVDREAAWWQQQAADLRRRRQEEHTAALRPLVEQLGSATVERIARQGDPRFELPASLRGIAPARREESNAS